MGWEHEPGTVWNAQELYCHDRLSFERVSEVTGVATSTLKRWADKYQWRERREELARIESEIRFDTIRGRQAILQRLIEADNGKEASQAAFAVASLESLALKQAELMAAGKLPVFSESASRPQIATRADAVRVLQEAIENKLGMALADPTKITADTIKDIRQCLDLMDSLKSSLPQPEEAEAEQKRGLSAEIAAALEKTLGVGNE